MEKYYIYALIYPDGHRWQGELAYIGKGCRNRHLKHKWLYSQPKKKGARENPMLRALYEKYGDMPVAILSRHQTDEEAHAEECRLIADSGRRQLKTGRLCNLTDGGEGASGARHSDESRAKRSVAKMGSKCSPEVADRLRKLRIGVPSPWKGKTPTPEMKERAKAGQQAARDRGEFLRPPGFKHSPESREKMRAAKLGKPSPKRGCKLPPEQAAFLRSLHVGRKARPETREKMAASQRARRERERQSEQPPA